MLFFNDKAAFRQSLLIIGGLIMSFVFAAVFCLNLIPSKSLAEQAQAIKIGEPKNTVKQVLGRPNEIFLPPTGTNINIITLMLCVHSETWAYGHWFRGRTDFPYFELNLRLFRPDTNDVTVSFDSKGRVAKVYIPGVTANQ